MICVTLQMYSYGNLTLKSHYNKKNLTITFSHHTKNHVQYLNTNLDTTYDHHGIDIAC